MQTTQNSCGYGNRPHFNELGTGVFAGSRFTVPRSADHPSRPHPDFRHLIEGSALSATVKARAGEMFRRLTECEAGTHGPTMDAVHFHELSAWGSIVDIVAVAHLVEALGVRSCTVSALGRGVERGRENGRCRG